MTREYLADLGLDQIRFAGVREFWIADLIWPATKTFPEPNLALADRRIGQKILDRDLRGRRTVVMHLENGETFDYLRRREHGIDAVVEEGGTITKVVAGRGS